MEILTTFATYFCATYAKVFQAPKATFRAYKAQKSALPYSIYIIQSPKHEVASHRFTYT